MKRALIALWLSAACLVLGSGSDPGRAQHSGAQSTPSHGAAIPQSGPANAVVEFENESIVVVRIRMAPGEKTPMHDITSARLVVWLTDAYLRDTHPDGSANETHRWRNRSSPMPGSRRDPSRRCPNSKSPTCARAAAWAWHLRPSSTAIPGRCTRSNWQMLLIYPASSARECKSYSPP